MPIPPLELEASKKYLSRFCEERIPHEIRDKVTLSFEVQKNSLILFENRPRYNDPTRWLSVSIAKFTYVVKSREWRLFYQDRNLKWRSYFPLPRAERLPDLIKEVELDPNCIYWG